MNTTNIYIYVDGFDLDEVADFLLQKIEEWNGHESSDVRIVNDRHPRTPDLDPEDLPEWYLGVNLNLAAMTREGLEETIEFFARLGDLSKRDFVIGCHDGAKGVSEDLAFVGFESQKRPAAEIVDIVLNAAARL